METRKKEKREAIFLSSDVSLWEMSYWFLKSKKLEKQTATSCSATVSLRSQIMNDCKKLS